MDLTAVTGGRWIRPCPPVPDSRSGQHLRKVLGRIDQESRLDGAQVTAAQPKGQCVLRTGDRHDSTRVPGLVDTAVGVAPAIDPEGMGGSLQPRTPAHGARPRRAGSSSGGRAVCDTTDPPSDRRAPRRLAGSSSYRLDRVRRLEVRTAISAGLECRARPRARLRLRRRSISLRCLARPDRGRRS
jgi:hypothetical protein